MSHEGDSSSHNQFLQHQNFMQSQPLMQGNDMNFNNNFAPETDPADPNGNDVDLNNLAHMIATEMLNKHL